ncbi:MAG: hypothetical protein AAGF12_17525 [Myxococcota bacterium]
MNRIVALALLFGGCTATVDEAPPAPLEPPRREAPVEVPPDVGEFSLTVDGVYNLVRQHEIRDVNTLIAALPDDLRRSFTLMEESGSRHLASLEHPRMILYGLDARLLFAASSDPADPLYDTIEMAEMDMVTGEWVFRVIDFSVDPPVLSSDDSGCVGCHGAPARPIWGNYPDWPGAFGGDDDRLTSAQADAVMQMKQQEHQSRRFDHLIYPSDHSIANNRTLYLADRSYGYANTVFNFELAVAVADGIVRRMELSEAWPARGYDVVAAHLCGGSVEDLTRAFDHFAIQGRNDFQLAKPIGEANGEGYDTFGWNQASTGLEDIVVFRVLDRLVALDDGLATAVEPIESTRSRWITHWFELRGDARASWLRDFDLYDYDLRPQELLPRVRGAVCEAVARQ